MTSILKDGYELVAGFLSRHQLEKIGREIDALQLPANAGGVRNAEKKYSSINTLAKSQQLKNRAKMYLSGEPSFVRAILFNKTKQNNWLVTWHQDKTVAVSKKFEIKGWGPWSVKDGVHHVQPPVEVLNQMVTFRISLDDSNQENGCLKVLPKSHELGILKIESIHEYTKTRKPVVCETTKGSALIMRPHILHSSSKAKSPTQRRVLHLEYSSFKLPANVEWAQEM